MTARVTVPITTCGQVVRRGEAGILMNDLVCGRLWGYCRACVTCFPPVEPPVARASSTDCPDPVTNDCYESGLDDSVGVWVNPGGRLYLNGHSIGRVHRGVSGILPDGTAPSASIRVHGPGTIWGTSEGSTAPWAACDQSTGLYGITGPAWGFRSDG